MNDSLIDNKLLLAMSSVPMLSILSENELLALGACMTLSEIPVGNFLMRQGAEDDSLYFMVEGQVKVCRADENGKEVILALLEKGDVIGEISALQGEGRSADVIAVMPCRLLKISSTDLKRHIKRFTGLSNCLLKLLASRLQSSSERITDLALLNVSARLARTLMSLAKPGMFNDEKELVVNPLPPHKELAAMVGSSREVVSRALKSLHEQGFFEYQESGVLILGAK